MQYLIFAFVFLSDVYVMQLKQTLNDSVQVSAGYAFSYPAVYLVPTGFRKTIMIHP